MRATDKRAHAPSPITLTQCTAWSGSSGCFRATAKAKRGWQLWTSFERVAAWELYGRASADVLSAKELLLWEDLWMQILMEAGAAASEWCTVLVEDADASICESICSPLLPFFLLSVALLLPGGDLTEQLIFMGVCGLRYVFSFSEAMSEVQNVLFPLFLLRPLLSH